MNYQERLIEAQNRICKLLKEKVKSCWEENRKEFANIELGAMQGLYSHKETRKARLEGENIAYEQVNIWLDSLLNRGKRK